ncbi:hypothetical protein [Methanothrix soehngenii]|uniref:hypothetical protein n=1 Tax=Methanothrix soehngenii TaxID=2223 RepID=UPI00300C3FEF
MTSSPTTAAVGGNEGRTIRSIHRGTDLSSPTFDPPRTRAAQDSPDLGASKDHEGHLTPRTRSPGLPCPRPLPP